MLLLIEPRVWPPSWLTAHVWSPPQPAVFPLITYSSLPAGRMNTRLPLSTMASWLSGVCAAVGETIAIPPDLPGAGCEKESGP